MSLKENDRFYEQKREAEEEKASMRLGWKYWQDKPRNTTLWDVHDFIFHQIKNSNK